MIFDWPLMPPTQLILIISLLIAIFTCLVHCLYLAVPPFKTGSLVFGGGLRGGVLGAPRRECVPRSVEVEGGNNHGLMVRCYAERKSTTGAAPNDPSRVTPFVRGATSRDMLTLSPTYRVWRELHPQWV